MHARLFISQLRFSFEKNPTTWPPLAFPLVLVPSSSSSATIFRRFDLVLTPVEAAAAGAEFDVGDGETGATRR